MASMCFKIRMHLRNGFTMLEMTYEFDKRLIHVGNDVYMREMAKIGRKWLKYLTNGFIHWELRDLGKA